MKIEVKERDIDCYDEILYMCMFAKKIINNPQTKVKKLSKHHVDLCLWISILLVMWYVAIILNDEVIFSWILFFFTFFLLCRAVKGYVYTKKWLKSYSEMTGVATFEITDDEVIVNKADGTVVSVKWDSIKNVIFNKYSIAFIQKEESSVVLSIGSKYADDVISTLNKFKKNSLIVDNRDLYK